MSSAQPRAIWGTKRLVLGSAERLAASAAEGASKPSPSSGRGLASGWEWICWRCSAHRSVGPQSPRLSSTS
jgi:hypothetical protein